MADHLAAPFLWVLGLFAGGTAGASFGGGGRGGGPPAATAWSSDPRRRRRPRCRRPLGADHVGLIVAVAGLLALVGLALLVVSLIAQGGLAGATADFASGRSSSLGRAWRTGLHLFWRYAGLWLLLIAAVAPDRRVGGRLRGARRRPDRRRPACRLGRRARSPGGPGAGRGRASPPGWWSSIVVPFAQRAIAVRDVGPLAALQDGWLVLRGHPGASLLVWLIDVALTVAAGLVITVAMVAAIVALGIPAAALWAVFELTTPTIAYLAIAAVVALGVLLTLISVANTFFWSYWTLAYLRLRSDHSADQTG